MFRENSKKVKEDIQKYIQTYILPLVVLSAALQQKRIRVFYVTLFNHFPPAFWNLQHCYYNKIAFNAAQKKTFNNKHNIL